MTTETPATGLELRSLVSAEGRLEISLAEAPVEAPVDNQVLIRVEAAPINPSDLGLLIAGADMTSASVSGTPERPVVTVALDPGVTRALSGRHGASMTVGNEGAGTVVAAGASPDAQALLGRTVAAAGGGMYSQYRLVDASLCLALPEGTPRAWARRPSSTR